MLHPPRPDEFGVRQRWLSDPEMMAYNIGWNIAHPGYHADTGCIDWPESEWPQFAARLARPASQQGYFYVRDDLTGVDLGHVHYEVDADGIAAIGLNVIPSRRGQELGSAFLGLLLDRVWTETAAGCAVNEFEDGRQAAVRLHRRFGFVPDAHPTGASGRPVRTWRLHRPSVIG